MASAVNKRAMSSSTVGSFMSGRRTLRIGRTKRFCFLGDDAAGVQLEVAAVLLDGGRLRVIHAMAMRERYRPRYEEATRWRL